MIIRTCNSICIHLLSKQQPLVFAVALHGHIAAKRCVVNTFRATFSSAISSHLSESFGQRCSQFLVAELVRANWSFEPCASALSRSLLLIPVPDDATPGLANSLYSNSVRHQDSFFLLYRIKAAMCWSRMITQAIVNPDSRTGNCLIFVGLPSKEYVRVI